MLLCVFQIRQTPTHHHPGETFYEFVFHFENIFKHKSNHFIVMLTMRMMVMMAMNTAMTMTITTFELASQNPTTPRAVSSPRFTMSVSIV